MNALLRHEYRTGPARAEEKMKGQDNKEQNRTGKDRIVYRKGQDQERTDLTEER